MPRSQISKEQAFAGAEKLQRAMAQIIEQEGQRQLDHQPTDGEIQRLVSDVNAVMDDVFGENTIESRRDFRVSTLWFCPNKHGANAWETLQAFKAGYKRTIETIESAHKRLLKKIDDVAALGQDKILQAYKGLDLHVDIARAASQLYIDGHYRNAVMDAVIALNNLVRLKSGEQRDGVALMEFVFSPKNPILRFNEMADDSDREEQKGYMMMFSGAVSGLRNPRAHSLFVDDPERSLEFIAFISLLAKLVEGSKRTKP